MVFDALGIGAGRFFLDAQGLEESNDDFVSMADLFGQLPARLGEKDRPIGFRSYQPLALQSGDVAIDAYVRHSQSAGDVHHAGLSGRCDQLGDRFHIILRQLSEMCASCSAVMLSFFGLARRLALGRLRRASIGFGSHHTPAIVARRDHPYNRRVAILAGIDEAGYGPTLGPLIVSATTFRVSERDHDLSLWKALQESCTQSVSTSDRRLCIADSKRLFRSRSAAGFGLLERAALVMLEVSGQSPRTWRDLLATVAPHVLADMRNYPWYSAAELSLPLTSDLGDLRTRANAVKRDATSNGVEFLGVQCAPLLEGHFNRQVRATRNKAVVLLGLVVQLMDRVMQLASKEPVCIYVDRLGGRAQYRETLTTAFPDWEMSIVEESSERSCYQLSQPVRTCRIEFLVEGENHHLPIALSSVYSKYLREGFMRLFNDYWSGHTKTLRPTAGYYTDAQRWLNDASPLLERLRVARDLLVRDR